jgi:hypothetical protein
MGLEIIAKTEGIHSLSANVEFDDKEIKKFLNRLEKNVPRKLKTLVEQTAQFGLREIKETLPARTGNARNRYRSNKINDYSYYLRNDEVKYLEGLESGFKARTVRPKRGKFLTIPTDDSVLTPTRARIKKMSKAGFRKAVKSGKIVLAKKANLPARPGNWYFRDKIKPSVQARLRRSIINLYKKEGFR